MKTQIIDLLKNVTGTYDQTKTTIQGRVTQKTILGTDYLGPPRTTFTDVFLDSGAAPSSPMHITDNGRVFCVSFASGTTTVIYYKQTPNSNQLQYQGYLKFKTPALTAIRGIRVVDNVGETGWKIFAIYTGSVVVNGGLYLVNSIDSSDFSISPSPIIDFATGNNQKAVYFLQDPANIASGQLNITSIGLSNIAFDNKIYVHNGTANIHQYYVYDSSTAPTYAKASVSVSVGSPAVVTYAGHPYLAGDAVVFTTGTLPTGLTVGTTYYVKAKDANSFYLSTTVGGANINTTGSPSVGAELGFAYGVTGSNFLFKTGNLPVLTGSLAIYDSENLATPQHSPLSGENCIFFATSTRLYLGKISELTSGATTWPSLISTNMLGSPSTIIAPTALQNACWSNVLDCACFVHSASKFVIKKFVDNSHIFSFGVGEDALREGQGTKTPVLFGALTNSGLNFDNGKLFSISSYIGQRGISTIDLFSDAYFGNSFVISPVVNTKSSVYRAISVFSDTQLENGGSANIEYRTSGFGSISGGWISMPTKKDLKNFGTGDQIQFKITFPFASSSFSSPTQLNSLLLTTQSITESSEQWELSINNTDSNSPTHVSFRLKEAYVGSVPKLYHRAHDMSNNLLITSDTVSNPTNFEYSTDNGTTWNALGTIPNVAGTLVKYTFTTPPGVDIRPSLKEE